jgi:hypothetical protein
MGLFFFKNSSDQLSCMHPHFHTRHVSRLGVTIEPVDIVALAALGGARTPAEILEEAKQRARKTAKAMA